MLTLDLPPAYEQIIVTNAQNQGISPENYIISLLPQRPASFYKARGILEGRLEEALAFQKQLRDEWDAIPV